MNKLEIYKTKANKAINMLKLAYKQKNTNMFNTLRFQALKDFKAAEIELNKLGVKNICQILIV